MHRVPRVMISPDTPAFGRGSSAVFKALCFSFSLLSIVIVTEADKQIIAKTKYGEVFRGVPYAHPPTQELRFKPPREPLPWGPSLILHTLEDPPGCPQDCAGELPAIACPLRIDEDCLYLNIFAPLTNSSNPQGHPVMLFIHGGNFRRGFCGGPLYDGQQLANTTSVVLVTINYRLGALGYLTHSQSGIGGNFGLMDQRMALQWVKENIENFGGNPNAVTLFGQSAGAISTAIHLASPQSAGLFHKAIVESEPFGISLRNLQDANKMGKDFLNYLGCKGDTSCIQSASITRVLEADTKTTKQLIDLERLLEIFLPWTPTVDGVEVNKQPLEAFQEGDIQNLPIIIGTVSEECVLYIYEVSPVKPVSVTEYRLALFAIFGLSAEKVRNVYPPDQPDTREVASRLATDYLFVCPTRNGSRSVVAHHTAPLWVYAFNHSWSFPAWGPNFTFCEHRVCHASELPFVFNSATAEKLYNITEAEKKLCATMNFYWTNFAHTSNPNIPPSNTPRTAVQPVNWPVFSASNNWKILNITTPDCLVEEHYLKEQCDFWDQFSYRD